jgi:hypothetical protein
VFLVLLILACPAGLLHTARLCVRVYVSLFVPLLGRGSCRGLFWSSSCFLFLLLLARGLHHEHAAAHILVRAPGKKALLGEPSQTAFGALRSRRLFRVIEVSYNLANTDFVKAELFQRLAPRVSQCSLQLFWKHPLQWQIWQVGAPFVAISTDLLSSSTAARFHREAELQAWSAERNMNNIEIALRAVGVAVLAQALGLAEWGQRPRSREVLNSQRMLADPFTLLSQVQVLALVLHCLLMLCLLSLWPTIGKNGS